MTTPDTERFRTGAAKYAAYLETFEGRLRLDLAAPNLLEFLPRETSLRVLDLGCGTGAMAVRLAKLGQHVTCLDSSEEMLSFAQQASEHAGVSARIKLQPGNVTAIGELFRAHSFDLILCHNILEYVDDPGTVLRAASSLLSESDGLISIVVRNQAGEALKAAIRDGDLEAAERNLVSEWGDESLYGGKVRLFTPDTVRRLLLESSLAPVADRGIRIVADYLPPTSAGKREYDRVFEFERKLGKRPEFTAVARYSHWLARRTSPISEEVG